MKIVVPRLLKPTPLQEIKIQPQNLITTFDTEKLWVKLFLEGCW